MPADTDATSSSLAGAAVATDGAGGVDCSVLVPVLDEERHINLSLDAMCRQRFPGRLEFLIVDGGSRDRTREIVAARAQQDPRIRLLENPRGDTPSGLNVALREARGRWVARMDAHTTYPEDYLARGVQRLQQGDAAWVSGPQVPLGDGTISRAVACALRTRLGRGGSRKWAERTGEEGPEYELDSGVFCGVWEREVVLRSGGWDERFARNQDSEMAGRFLAAGERLICIPAMAASYVPRNSLPGLWRQYHQYGLFRARTATRHPHTLRRSALLPPVVVLCLAGAITGPRTIRLPSRLGALLYGAALGSAGLDAARDARCRNAAARVPVVLGTMHLAHGTGFIRGTLRRDPPVSALLRAVGLRALAARWEPAREPVYAPSLGTAATEAVSRDSAEPLPASSG